MAATAHITSRFSDEVSSHQNRQPHARRGFLRGLLTLPLVGGGVTLIGQPIAVAAPLTRPLLESYDAWLFYERRILAGTLRPEMGNAAEDFCPLDNRGAKFHFGDRYDHQEAERDVRGRAALVLSAVGCDWRV